MNEGKRKFLKQNHKAWVKEVFGKPIDKQIEILTTTQRRNFFGETKSQFKKNLKTAQVMRYGEDK